MMADRGGKRRSQNPGIKIKIKITIKTSNQGTHPHPWKKRRKVEWSVNTEVFCAKKRRISVRRDMKT
jgi:hypothetical protein